MQAPAVILVRPQMGENIGAVARAMSNFGLSELRLVRPRDGWPNKKAAEMAAGAADIIDGVRVFSEFSDALADLQFAYATTVRPRGMHKPVMEPAEAMAQERIQRNKGLRTALVFGPERTGLENEEVALCDCIITIPTSPTNTSLNVAQASVVVGYEWWRAQAGAIAPQERQEVAPREEFMGLLGQLEEYLDEVNYYRVADKKTIMWQNVQTMLMRGQWSSQEVRSMRGLLRAIWEKRKRGEDAA